MARAISPWALGVRAKRYLNSALLVIDEVGFRPLDRQEANLFFRVVSARYEKGSIILTSNKHVRDWPEIFAGDEILTTAILDRLLHHVHIIHIDGRSYRLREIDGLLRPQMRPAHLRLPVLDLLELCEQLVRVLILAAAVLAPVVAQHRLDLHAVLLEEGEHVVVQDLGGRHRHRRREESGPHVAAGRRMLERTR